MDNLDGSSSSEKTSSSSDSENENPVHGESKVEETKQKSRQLQYYHRKTGGKMKRKYTLFRDQENPSRQLKRYHGVVREACSTLPASMNTAGSAERISETNINEDMQIGTTVEIQNEEKEISPYEFEDEAAFNTSTTSSSAEESGKSFSDSDNSVSGTESEEWDNEPEDIVPERENETATTLPDEEKPLFQGSTISKILSCVLIVSFRMKKKRFPLMSSKTKLPSILAPLLRQRRKVENHFQIVTIVFLERKVKSGITNQKISSPNEKTKPRLRFLTRRSHFFKEAQYRKFYRVS